MARVRLVKARCQLVGIEAPVGLAQPHVLRLGAGEDRVGAVVLVERLEDDHFVAGIDARQHHAIIASVEPQQTVTCSSAIDRHAVAAREVRRRWLSRNACVPYGGAY